MSKIYINAAPRIKERSEKNSSRVIAFEIFRFNAQYDILPTYKRYELKVKKSEVLLDALNRIKAEIDPSLSYRKSCRHGICGSCALKAQNQAVLACKANLFELADRYGDVLIIDPLDKSLAFKDLIVDKTRFWDSYRAVSPWLEAPIEDAPKKENLIEPKVADRLNGADACIECGICFYSCPAVAKNQEFLGPAALAKSYRFITDVRDQKMNDRLRFVDNQKIGVWDCAKCYQCYEVCPKEVSPIDKIIELRENSFSAGVAKDSIASRHAKAFLTSIAKRGRLDEAANVHASLGTFGALMRMREAFVMFKRGKLPFTPPKIEKHDEVKKLIDIASRSRKIDQ
ncbi:MAG: succinate dehydrogenase iron-sulfur subunit [Helicobacteraceae bacterium]|jgi:succinate dehydrogenase / fumarate reductase iron-sulfur subunit|nr:succinate dehydrogenase iron-sulfur subunit [Helicobacteraceae bacterium]